MTDRKPNRTEPESLYSNNEHHEDKKSRQESQAIAVVHVDLFSHEHAEELKALLWTYGDKMATEKLESLREKFWTELPPPSGKGER